MALSDTSGYCEACAAHKKTLRRLYNGITFTMICEECFEAGGYRVKTGSSRQDHRRLVLAEPDLRLRYACWHAHLGCSARTNDLSALENHAKSCKFTSVVTCTRCWQAVPVADYEDHKDGSKGVLRI
ncbi:hypothetical protein PLEOSDRAFT_1069652 [Pleurotus ostreatus PC15]|uniref:Uncharacterized protein n=1 Tax=Pleurotus ostreatus (strain PC15) TaxID=1137138 RepID=A0A067PBS2_PLEO1|nr:hypothetical protein PLEOSDRAFT_1069652 [Pleurotus ostreatus PC15]